MTKLEQLQQQKEKIEAQLKEEMNKRLIQIGNIAKKTNILHWSNQELETAFKFLAEQGQREFQKKEEQEKRRSIKNSENLEASKVEEETEKQSINS